ncbi:hypothetical protein NWFMUON74_41060 [Nocardia wallacei]|uniref:Uncharacterized protein n=2 Tax=Nocardia wallacei TaxID=480035 RepID=A0A7G1KT16_9NOCA|nr:hypothetical protein NWFMUON74_41060 [Nocardia wallacei]
MPWAKPDDEGITLQRNGTRTVNINDKRAPATAWYQAPATYTLVTDICRVRD